MDAHSNCTGTAINNLIKINNFSVVDYAIRYLEVDNRSKSRIESVMTDSMPFTLISPDAGAMEKCIM